MPPDPPPCGTHAVQVLRTYARRRGGYPFAPRGERSVARGFRKAIGRARRLIYIEDQFLWSAEVAAIFAAALVASPSLHLIAVLPRFFDQAGALTLRPNQVGRERAVQILLDAAGDRVSIYDIENGAGVPVYVHAKISVIDDVWASVGSDNFNRRSWSHDSEIACAVVDDERDLREPVDPAGLGDGARTFARDLRLQLWREHLGRADGDDRDLLDPVEAVTDLSRSGADAGPLAPGRPAGRTAAGIRAAASPGPSVDYDKALGGAAVRRGLRPRREAISLASGSRLVDAGARHAAPGRVVAVADVISRPPVQRR